MFSWGKKAGTEIMEWIDEVDIYIQPSLVEGLPRATIEAMSRGCPVVGTDVGAMQELVDEEFIVEIKNDQLLSEKINEISCNIRTMKEQAIRNFEKAKKYEEKVKQQKYRTFYHQIIEEIEGKRKSVIYETDNNN